MGLDFALEIVVPVKFSILIQSAIHQRIKVFEYINCLFYCKMRKWKQSDCEIVFVVQKL